LPVGKSLDLLNVTAEIANFVERVPGSHLELQLSLHIRDFHGDVEKVLLGMRKRDLIADGGVRARGEKQ
jgi:hypothetical protein